MEAGGVLKLDWIILIPEDNYKFKCAGVAPHYCVSSRVESRVHIVFI